MFIELKLSYLDMKGFSVRNLKNMWKYYLVCSKNKKVQKASALFLLSHNILIFDKIKSDNDNDNDNPSIGLILCKDKNKFSVDYALKDINKPIGVSSYELTKYLPENLIEELPTEEDLNLHINLENH